MNTCIKCDHELDMGICVKDTCKCDCSDDSY